VRRFALLALFLLSACSPTYVVRGAYEEARILLRREPIVERLADPAVSPEEKEKLRLVLMVREFASQRLGLDVGGSYRTYATIGPDQTIYAVSAAPRFALVPYTWWFPFVGHMPYKGYFSEDDARREARSLEAENYDTIVVPVAAFSTLGWFDDPLLSNLLRHDDVVLAQIVLHELTHNTYYAPGQAAFNESFANFVGVVGAFEFFRALDGYDAPRTQKAWDFWKDDRTYSVFIGELTDHLREAYARGITLEEREALFSAEQANFAAIHWSTDSYRSIAKAKLNNAVILQQDLYHHELVVFDGLYMSKRGDLRQSIAAAIELARAGGDPFTTLKEQDWYREPAVR
jgi:predicted aminopeptidase